MAKQKKNKRIKENNNFSMRADWESNSGQGRPRKKYSFNGKNSLNYNYDEYDQYE